MASAAERQLALALVALATLPYEACVQPRRDRAHAVAPACLATAGCWSGRPRPRRRAASRPTAHRRICCSNATGAWPSPRRLALITFAGLTVERPEALVAALPVLLLWARGRRAIVWWLNRPLAAAPVDDQRRRGAASCACWRAAPGRSSRPSSGPPTTTCRPTTCRSIRSSASRTAPRRPTSACRCWPTSPRTTSAT